MNSRWLLSRRALLGGLGGLGLSTLLRPRRALAAPPTRFVVVHVPEGMWAGAPRPTPGGATFGPILAPLEPFRDYVTVLNNLDMASRVNGPGPDGHPRAVGHMLTGTEMLDDNRAGGPSVDQRIAQAIGRDSRHQSLQFAVRIVYDGLVSRPIWSQAGKAVPPLQDPWEAYTRIFGDVITPSASAQPVVDLRKSALDNALEELNTLRGRLPAADQQRLDSYHESLRDIERRLQVMTTADCVKPVLGNKIDIRAEANYPKVGRLQMDLLAAALQCGITRVASLQWGNSNDQCSYSWLGVNNLGHDLAHNNGNCDPGGAKKLKVYRWYAEQFAYLLGKLAAVPEGDGSMLDNTAVLWVSEFGSSNGHTYKELMWVLMGNVGGYFRTGRTINCEGRSTNDVHTSLCNAFGLPDKTFGNPKFCGGPLQALL
jgi:hypothetical protein